MMQVLPSTLAEGSALEESVVSDGRRMVVRLGARKAAQAKLLRSAAHAVDSLLGQAASTITPPSQTT